MDSDSPTTPGRKHEAEENAQSVGDEELFAAYLAARLQQALDALNQAREELVAQPEDFNRALHVMRRVHELRELHGQLEAQHSRVKEARATAGIEAGTDEPHVIEQTDAGPAFRAAQSEQAARIMAALAAQPRTCPSCQALLPANSARCHCGYTVDAAAASTQYESQTEKPTPPTFS